MPDVICDTSPLQYLDQIGLLHILPALAGHIIVAKHRLGMLRFRLASHTREAVLKMAGE